MVKLVIVNSEGLFRREEVCGTLFRKMRLTMFSPELCLPHEFSAHPGREILPYFDEKTEKSSPEMFQTKVNEKNKLIMKIFCRSRSRVG